MPVDLLGLLANSYSRTHPVSLAELCACVPLPSALPCSPARPLTGSPLSPSLPEPFLQRNCHASRTDRTCCCWLCRGNQGTVPPLPLPSAVPTVHWAQRCLRPHWPQPGTGPASAQGLQDLAARHPEVGDVCMCVWCVCACVCGVCVHVCVVRVHV